MHTFVQKFRHLKRIKNSNTGDYRFCWIPFDKNGSGIYSTIEFFDDELSDIDPNKIEIIVY